MHLTIQYLIKMSDTLNEFNSAFSSCEKIFEKKLSDYGASWRVMRVPSITDQILIKARRIRTLENGSKAMVDEGVLPEFIAMVNYGIIGIIQMRCGVADLKDMTPGQALDLYRRERDGARSLMIAKNHDYGEAWREMRVSSFTDIILTKLLRVKEIEDNNGVTCISEGIDSNYQDIINYSIFAIIKLTKTDE